jgi:hypothetical protein
LRGELFGNAGNGERGGRLDCGDAAIQRFHG